MTEHPSIRIRPPHASERAWLEHQLTESWGSTTVVSRGRVHDASRLSALVAVQGGELVGLATFALANADASWSHSTRCDSGRVSAPRSSPASLNTLPNTVVGESG